MDNSFLGSSIKIALLLASVFAIVACGGNSEDQHNTEAAETEVSDTANRTANARLNINTATADAFRSIPNVGDKMVHEFEEYRPYVSITQFRKEIGKYVNESQVSAFEKHIYVPISRNDSDVATLMQIPGLDKGEAQGVVNARPYESNKMFFDALKSYISDREVQIAMEYTEK